MSAMKTAAGFVALSLMFFFVIFGGRDRRNENLNWERENRAQMMMQDSGMVNNLNQNSRNPNRRFGMDIVLEVNQVNQNFNI